MLITISNELLDNFNDLSPAYLEKLRQKRFSFHPPSLIYVGYQMNYLIISMTYVGYFYVIRDMS